MAPARAATLLAAAALAAGSGCVERRLFIRSDPPGARVFVDGEVRGEAPVRVPFMFYGTREVVVRAPRHEPARILYPARAPWYEWPPFDFFSDLIVPFTIVDEHVIDFRLEPASRATEADAEALRARAEGARKEADE